MSESLACLPDEVAVAEHAYIEAWRRQNGRSGKPQLTGLALSGGGIRSAVFCLGALQALANHNVLKHFDYLSTVSGGGYIGASLTWFTGSTMPFGVAQDNIPYGIDDPTQQPPKHPPGRPLLPHLRRHGSYLDPGGSLSLLAGVAVVLRGIVLNLFVIWLPIVMAMFVALRVLYRWAAYGTANDGKVWLQPATFPAAVAVVFAALAIVYSLYSGWQAKVVHQDMPYRSRQEFESITPYVLTILALLLVVGSLPYVRDIVRHDVASQGIAGFAMTAGGAALGLWSRFMPKGAAADNAPAWVGPVGAALVIYGIGLSAYTLSDIVFAGVRIVPGGGSLAVIIAIAVLAAFVGYFVDLNETTLHRFYRDRLMEAFMPDIDSKGAPIGKRASKADAGRLRDMCDPANPKAPYHLICAHLVLTRINRHGVDPRWLDRWRIRGGDSFVFSPRYCGGHAVGWHATATNKAFSELSLPTAMAVSGAAVNPDAASAGVGPQRNMLFAILMALLNIRLGIWLPNPAKYANRPHAPAPNHFNAGLAGVLDCTSQTGRFLEVTDGGDFENLGVYELLRRGVQTILVCDATADPQSAFADLQNLLSRAEADFGVTITFTPPPLGPLMPSKADARFPLGVAFAKQPFVVGEIGYPNGATGKLYYIKPAIFSGLRLHVLGFKGAFPAFPDDSTVDQFFDEARFEAYRELGFACVDKMLADADILEQLTRM
jgi:Patatin-like phospholipase